MTTWTEFAWCAFLYKAISSGDQDYQCLMQDVNFLEQIGNDPSRARWVDIQDKLITGFLNKWKTRVSKSEPTARALQAQIVSIHPFLASLSSADIDTVDFGQLLAVKSATMTISDAIKECYGRILEVKGIGPTATGKILHVLQPKLFVMWDAKILSDFQNQCELGADNNGKVYVAYLQNIQEVARQVAQDFVSKVLHPPAQRGETPSAYLSARLNYDPAKTMAKYLDEYKWITVTNKDKVEIPPSWHPEKSL